MLIKYFYKTPKAKKFISSLFDPYTYNINKNLAARWGVFWSIIFVALSFFGHYSHDYASVFHPETHVIYWIIVFLPLVFYPIVGATGTLELKENLETTMQLKRSTIKYETLVDNLPEIVYSSSPNNKFEITFISPNIEHISGYKPFEFYIDSELFQNIIHPDDRKWVFKKSAKINGELCYSYRIIHKDTKKIHYVRDRLIPIIEENKKIAIEGIIVDITNEINAKRRLTVLAREIISTQEKERKRIAKELHDEVGQAITAIKINLTLIEKELGPNFSEIRKGLKQTDQIADRLLIDLKRISLDLRPSMLDDLGLNTTLQWYIKKFRERTGIKVILNINNLQRKLPVDLEITLYRIIQEALTNIIRHSSASKAFINIMETGTKGSGKSIYMYVADNGSGFSVEEAFNPETRGISFGIIGIQERVKNLGGDFKITSSKDKGTRLLIYIPVDFLEENHYLSNQYRGEIRN